MYPTQSRYEQRMRLKDCEHRRAEDKQTPTANQNARFTSAQCSRSLRHKLSEPSSRCWHLVWKWLTTKLDKGS